MRKNVDTGWPIEAKKSKNFVDVIYGRAIKQTLRAHNDFSLRWSITVNLNERKTNDSSENRLGKFRKVSFNRNLILNTETVRIVYLKFGSFTEACVELCEIIVSSLLLKLLVTSNTSKHIAFGIVSISVAHISNIIMLCVWGYHKTSYCK